jgi:hypothetical protein
MKIAVLVASLTLLLVPKVANAQACLDPPTNQYGQCAKQTGGRCDPAKGWVGQNHARFRACMGQPACLDPPTAKFGQCSKQAGGRCDPAKGWVGHNKAQFSSCMRG